MNLLTFIFYAIAYVIAIICVLCLAVAAKDKND